MRTVALLDELKSLVKQLAAKGGHRTLLLLSDGFHLSAGREPWGYLVAFLPELSQYAPRGGERLSSEFDGVVRTAARSNVVINTVDSRGLYVSSVNDASIGSMGGASAMPRIESAVQGLETEAGFALSELAAATGGTSFANSNDLIAGVQRAIADGRDYYTLSYVSTNPNLDGKFRKIEVIVKGRKLTVQAKRGYWATEN